MQKYHSKVLTLNDATRWQRLSRICIHYY